ncbi:glycosyltransferase family 2 protein [Cytobacillus oceanisediminis]|uniref:glycosyltransferase family 2 protein n=1 Tax=Cytobacillus oceanisediminis TaxID=665099 RepID=UPI001C21F93A|nr:glycosyltransferase family 2 protein [Cytobacillus oceanisediminis]MBU8772130.1 glycosyltransferase family 2 protein [Cytobacillus oceanisediminis]
MGGNHEKTEGIQGYDMNIVIPMAGRGNRFKEKGIFTPKPLIDVAGKPMFYWALDSINGQVPLEKIIFVCLKDDIEKYPLEEAIYTYSRKAKLMVIDSVTSGQAETVQLASPMMEINEPLIIFNCDTYLRSSIGTTISKVTSDINGIISIFKSYDPCLSYVKLNQGKFVDQVVEKEVISSYATTGLYHFSSARLFMNAIEEATVLNEKSKGEYFVGPLYNILIRKGYRFTVDYAKQCIPLGTPQQLDTFLKTIDILK